MAVFKNVFENGFFEFSEDSRLLFLCFLRLCSSGFYETLVSTVLRSFQSRILVVFSPLLLDGFAIVLAAPSIPVLACVREENGTRNDTIITTRLRPTVSVKNARRILVDRVERVSGDVHYFSFEEPLSRYFRAKPDHCSYVWPSKGSSRRDGRITGRGG